MYSSQTSSRKFAALIFFLSSNLSTRVIQVDTAFSATYPVERMHVKLIKDTEFPQMENANMFLEVSMREKVINKRYINMHHTFIFSTPKY